MAFGFPVATRTGLPPCLGTDQMETASGSRRAKKTLDEFRASAAMLVPSAMTRMSSWKVAVRLVSAVSGSSVQGDEEVLWQGPVHETKWPCGVGVAVRLRIVPWATVTWHAVAPFPQAIPGPETWPGPFTVTVNCT